MNVSDLDDHTFNDYFSDFLKDAMRRSQRDAMIELRKEADRKSEILRAEIEALKKQIYQENAHVLYDPEGPRPVTEGWVFKPIGGASFYRTCSEHSVPTLIARVGENGIYPAHSAAPALDGIAHDDKGRIKVVGYVNAEDLKAAIRDRHTERYLREGGVIQIINELAG